MIVVGWMLGEVVPFAVPQFDFLLISLVALMGCLVALGMVSILRRFTRNASHPTYAAMLAPEGKLPRGFE